MISPLASAAAPAEISAAPALLLDLLLRALPPRGVDFASFDADDEDEDDECFCFGLVGVTAGASVLMGCEAAANNDASNCAAVTRLVKAKSEADVDADEKKEDDEEDDDEDEDEEAGMACC